MRDRMNHRSRFLDRGREFIPKRKYFVTYDKYDNYCRHLFDTCDSVKTQAQDI